MSAQVAPAPITRSAQPVPRHRALGRRATEQAALRTGEGHPRRRAVLAVMCLSLLVVVVDNTVLNTALPTLARVLHATTSDLQWITDAYTLVFAALLIVAGGLGDRFGRRGALIGGLAVFAAGSAAAALSHSSGQLIAFRAVMGLGGAFVMPATLSIINSVFPAPSGPGRSGPGRRCPGSPSSSARLWAACCSSTTPGTRCSGSTSP